jgi:curli biogenesis system outer membrane secretion channel CsgG
MNKLLILLSLSLILFSICHSQTSEKRQVAVISIQAYEGVSQGEAEVLSDQLRTELLNTGKFKVMEREQMDEILKEQGFSLSGCTSNECIIRAGRLLSVEEIIGGSVGRFGDIYTLSLRLISVETGEILDSKTDNVSGDKNQLLTVSVKKLAFDLAKTSLDDNNSKQSKQSELLGIHVEELREDKDLKEVLFDFGPFSEF